MHASVWSLKLLHTEERTKVRIATHFDQSAGAIGAFIFDPPFSGLYKKLLSHETTNPPAFEHFSFSNAIALFTVSAPLSCNRVLKCFFLDYIASFLYDQANCSQLKMRQVLLYNKL